MRLNYSVIIMSFCALMFSGCTSIKGDPYLPGDIQSQGLQTGTIVHVGASSVTQEPTMVGPIVGGTTGALVGGAILGSGTAGTIGMLTGGALGAIVGGAGEQGVRRTEYGLALTIELDNGRTIIVAQPEDDIYTVGDRVRLMRDKEGYGRAQLL